MMTGPFSTSDAGHRVFAMTQVKRGAIKNKNPNYFYENAVCFGNKFAWLIVMILK